MKICIATGIYPPSIGGPATYSKLLFDELPKRGIGVKVLSYDEVRHLPKGISHLVYFFKLIFKAKGCDIIFAQDPVSVGLPALFVSRILGKKFFLRVAGDYAWEQGVSRFGVEDSIDDFQKNRHGFFVDFLKKIQKFVVLNANKIITPSKYFKDLVSGWGIPTEKIVHIYNGIESCSVYDKNLSRNMVNIPQSSTVLVTAGRLVQWKGILQLIEAFNLLGSKYQNLSLYILGDGEEEKKIRKQIQQLKLGGSVFVVGRVDRDTMFRYLSASDIFVLNTSFESFSFQIVEAMCVGLPIVSTSVCNIPEIVESGEQGFLIEPNNIPQMTTVLGELIDSPSLRTTMGIKGKERAKLFTKDVLLENLTKILK